MHIILVGTKAQLVKMAPVLIELRNREIAHKFVLTGQHSETVDDLITGFCLSSPDDILVPNHEADSKQKLLCWARSAWKTINALPYLDEARSIVVHGDTLSTLLGALLGRKRKIPVVHIEAGLRSFDILNPFPEEIIRILVSKLSTTFYAPGENAVKNLTNNRVPAASIIDTGENTILDSLRIAISSANSNPLSGEPYCVVSLHRHENQSSRKRFDLLMEFVFSLSATIHVKFVMHPVTRRKLHQTGWTNRLENQGVKLMDRMSYIPFIALLKSSRFLVTDGGSNQEEAACMGLPCLIARLKTERHDGIGKNAVLSELELPVMNSFVQKHALSEWHAAPPA